MSIEIPEVAEKVSLRGTKCRSNLFFEIASLTLFARNDTKMDFFSNLYPLLNLTNVHCLFVNLAQGEIGGFLARDKEMGAVFLYRVVYPAAGVDKTGVAGVG